MRGSTLALTCVLLAATTVAGAREAAAIARVQAGPGNGQVAVVRLGADGTPYARMSTPADLDARRGGDPVLMSAPLATRTILAGTRTDQLPPRDDAGRDLQWALTRLRAEDAWTQATGAGVTVAVLDTGVSARHPDLRGKVDSGFDAIDRRGGADGDPNGHGTLVAGIIAGDRNGSGITGLAPGTRILPVRVIGPHGAGTSVSIFNGIIWAVQHGADVINMSFGSRDPDRVELSAIEWARARGVILIAAAGNDGSSAPLFPAAYDGPDSDVIGVGATTRDDLRARFSQTGPSVDVAAPGTNILTTAAPARRSFGWASGTSMAAPFVSATAALGISWLRSSGQTDPAEMRDRVTGQLRRSSVDLGPPGTDQYVGSGRVDPVNLLASLGARPPQQTPGDLAVRSTSASAAELSFSATAGSAVSIQMAISAPPAPGATYSEPRTIWSGFGTGSQMRIPVSGLASTRAYSFWVSVQGDLGTSRSVTGLRPVQLSIGQVPRPQRESGPVRIAVGTRVSGLGLASGIALTLHMKTPGRTPRAVHILTSGCEPDVVAARLDRRNTSYRLSALGSTSFWPADSGWHPVRSVTALRSGDLLATSGRAASPARAAGSADSKP